MSYYGPNNHTNNYYGPNNFRTVNEYERDRQDKRREVWREEHNPRPAKRSCVQWDGADNYGNDRWDRRGRNVGSNDGYYDSWDRRDGRMGRERWDERDGFGHRSGGGKDRYDESNCGWKQDGGSNQGGGWKTGKWGASQNRKGWGYEREWGWTEQKESRKDMSGREQKKEEKKSDEEDNKPEYTYTTVEVGKDKGASTSSSSSSSSQTPGNKTVLQYTTSSRVPGRKKYSTKQVRVQPVPPTGLSAKQLKQWKCWKKVWNKNEDRNNRMAKRDPTFIRETYPDWTPAWRKRKGDNWVYDLPSMRTQLEKWRAERDAKIKKRAENGTLYRPHYSDSEDSLLSCEHRDNPDSDDESIESEFSDFYI